MTDTLTNLSDAAAITDRMRQEIGRAIIGQSQVIEEVLIAFLAAGHVLIEGVPGLGKTLLARALAKTFDGKFARIQFTPDLMPNDITGHVIYDQNTQKFNIRRGPVFTHLLLADEINRAPAKTQSALLEVMQEQQVSIEGQAMQVPQPFMALATQNPIEQEGTYPLPEAQLDRFLARIEMTLPDRDNELALFRMALEGKTDWGPETLPAPVLTPEQSVSLRPGARSVHVADELLDYLQRLAAEARASEQLELVVSPRGVLALLELGRATALIEGRDHVIPDDFKRNLFPYR